MRRVTVSTVVSLVVGALLVALVPFPPAPTAAAAPAPPAAPSPSPPPPRRVDIFGDSVVLGGAKQIKARLRDANWAPRVMAIPGVSIEQVAAAVIDAPSVSDVVVLGLGYSYFWKPFVLRRDIDALMFALSKRNVRRVIWLNVRENRPERRDVNMALNAATRRWGNLEIADWDRLAKGRRGIFLPDGHHLQPAGGTLMGGLMLQRLRAYAANAPRAPLPVYGSRVESQADVQGYGAPDGNGAGAAARRYVRRSPLAAIAATASGNGYWLVRRDGALRAFGDARNLGSPVNLDLAEPVVGIAATRSGRGYWIVASDGGVFSYGDARFHGSTGAIRLNKPIVGITRTPRGRGYWLVASDGGVFSFGDAHFYGSTGNIVLNEPIVGMAPHPNGRGYWLLAYDGGIFTFGAARYFGSGATTPRYWKVMSMAPTADGKGYWLLAANGEVLPFGTAADEGWRPSLTVLFYGIVARRDGGYWLAAQGRPAA